MFDVRVYDCNERQATNGRLGKRTIADLAGGRRFWG